MKKNAKKCKKICIYQKKAVPLHRHLKKTPISNPIRNQKKTKIMKTIYKVITKSSVVNLPTKSQVSRRIIFLHKLGLHNRDIKIEEININE